jgi:hypothetical protein
VNGSFSALFAVNAFYIYGDPNNDININVADITTIIDQIIGKQSFSFVDSLKADMNKDGLIDTADVNLLIGTILDRPTVFATLPPFIPERTAGPKSDDDERNRRSRRDSSLKRERSSSPRRRDFV